MRWGLHMPGQMDMLQPGGLAPRVLPQQRYRIRGVLRGRRRFVLRHGADMLWRKLGPGHDLLQPRVHLLLRY